MYISLCLYIYIYMYVCIYIYIYIYIHIDIYRAGWSLQLTGLESIPSASRSIQLMRLWLME